MSSPDNLPATMPAGASAFYARNISALLLGMVKDGAFNLDFEDEVTKATVITHGGEVVSEAVRKLLDAGTSTAGGAAASGASPAPAGSAAPPPGTPSPSSTPQTPGTTTSGGAA